RAEEIRGLVADVLSDADTRASALSQWMTAGWSEHFFLASPDGRFKLQLAGLLQFRYVWNYHDQADTYRSGFENTRTQLTLSGHVFTPDLTYLVRGDFNTNGRGLTSGFRDDGTFVLKDAWTRHQLADAWSVRFGQFKLPFTREELVGPSRQLAVERSLVNESLNLGRSQGIELTYHDDLLKATVAVSDAGEDSVGGFGIVGTEPQNEPWSFEDTEYAVTFRVEYLAAGSWGQFADFTSPAGDEFDVLLGIAGHAQQAEANGAPTFVRDEDRWFAWTADASVEWGGANAFASFTHHYIDDPALNHINVFGMVAQGGVYLTPKLEAFARFEYGIFDIDAADFPDLTVLTLGGNYYFEGHDAKLSADIGFGISQISTAWDSDIAGWRSEGEDAEPQVVIRSQFQLQF
ncbi:MAG: porin, partial [Planctomycetota bacterium]